MKEVDCIGCLHYAACKNLMQHMSYTPTKCGYYKNGNLFVKVPCKIGDIGFAFYIRKSKYNTNPKPVIKEGRITDIRFNANMDLLATVHRVATGVIGKTVFATKDEAEQALKKWRNNG